MQVNTSKDDWYEHLRVFHVILILLTKVLNVLNLFFLGCYYQQHRSYRS